MNILFLTLTETEKLHPGNMYHDLMKEFQKNGHQVYIVAPRERYRKLSTALSVEEGIHVLNVKTGNITKTNFIEKGISTLLLEQFFLKAIQKYYADVTFDLILYPTPPVTFSKVVSYIKKRDKAPTYLMLKDIFPQNGVDIGLYSKKSVIYKYFRQKEKNLYQQSDFIGCMSPANIDYLKNHNPYLKNKRIEVCPNTITPQEVTQSPSERKTIRNHYHIPQDKVVFIYGGNLGKPQGIDFLIECLKKNEANINTFFLIIGNGTDYHKLRAYFTSAKPKNAKLLSQLPFEEYNELVKSGDVGLIFLDYRFTIPNFPSRILSYMQMAIPVLTATDPATDIGKIATDNKFGFECLSNDAETFNQYVNKLTDARLRYEMGQNARNYLENNYTTKHAYEIIIKHFKNEIGMRKE